MATILLTTTVIVGFAVIATSLYSAIAMKRLTQSRAEQIREDDEQERYVTQIQKQKLRSNTEAA